ncbi:MAG: PAS domain S-box protein [Anaerolineales bacterium]|nr:PAS domain S-box protein [Anaerolineales bacterium]
MMTDLLEILLIEDDDAHAELIQRAFEDQKSPFQIQRVKSITEARAHKQNREPALIIADWRLPDGESMELLPAQPDALTSTPIILMTSYGNEEIAVEALKSGALDYVVKSPESMLDMPHLAEKAIEQWLARKEKKRIQNELAERESQFRLLAENASDMISRLSTDGVILYISPACQPLLGYTPEELTGRPALNFIETGEREAVAEDFYKTVENEINIFTFRALTKSGKYIWLETSAKAVLDPFTSELIEVQAASRDITERKNAEKELQAAHEDLQEAYEKTIEGWVHALDLRDRETEGHTQRVTELTLRVARKLGYSEDELVHIRRGALLHDMGKMAIPDEILQKPGPLTEDEWKVMRKHPEHAYNMLSAIAYLHPALDIPLFHHERWDGSGYPKGLKGEDIPKIARLFAIVDVWDALSSDRPYRKSMPRKDVIAYIKENASRLFDPTLVEVFLSLIETQSLNQNQS